MDELAIIKASLEKINNIYNLAMDSKQYQAAVEATMSATQLQSTIYKYEQQQKAFEAQKASEAEYKNAVEKVSE